MASYPTDLDSLTNIDQMLDDFFITNPEAHYKLVHALFHQDESFSWDSLISELSSSGWGSVPVPAAAVEPKDPKKMVVNALMRCAECIMRGNKQMAALLITYISNVLLQHICINVGIGKVALYFIEALNRRIYFPVKVSGPTRSRFDTEANYTKYYEAAPYLKFAHFTANQAILMAFRGHDFVHVIDLSPTYGLQWPPLIEALSVRAGGPPFIRITAVGPTTLRDDVGSNLIRFAKERNVCLAYHVMSPTKIEKADPTKLNNIKGEAVVVNSIQELHKFIGSNITRVLKWIRDVNPKLLTVVEQEANLNKNKFVPRFAETLCYYTTLLDSLDACPDHVDNTLAELYLQKEVTNILCFEGAARVERFQPLARWRNRLNRAGFKQIQVGPNAVHNVSTALNFVEGGDHEVANTRGCLKLMWQGCTLITFSVWRVDLTRRLPRTCRLPRTRRSHAPTRGGGRSGGWSSST